MGRNGESWGVALLLSSMMVDRLLLSIAKEFLRSRSQAAGWAVAFGDAAIIHVWTAATPPTIVDHCYPALSLALSSACKRSLTYVALSGVPPEMTSHS